MGNFEPTPRTQIRRRAQRGHYDRATIYCILDEAFVCHVGFVADGYPVVIPTAYGRDGDMLYLHGAPLNRMLTALAAGVEACVTVTLVDGLVLARSAFHHSINYRSVVIFGRARAVTDPDAKRKALRIYSEHLIPGRWDAVREPTKQEIDTTLVVELPIEEASAKVRTGPPIDDEDDMQVPVWAGVLPMELIAGAPDPDPMMPPGAELPDHVRNYSRR